MKDKPEPSQMLLDDSWDGLPVIQRQEESLVEEVPDSQETLPVEDSQAVDVSPNNAELPGAEDPSPPDTSLKLFQAEETKEAVPPVEDILPIDRPPEQVEEPPSVALVEPRNGNPVPKALLDPPEVPQAETPPSVMKPRITQVEAMRQAVNDLGLTAKNAALAEYLQEKFGLLPRNIAVLKSTVKKTFFSKTEPAHQDLPEPEQTAGTESIQEVVVPEPNGVLQPAEPVLAESETLLPEPAVLQVEATEEPPIEQGGEVSSELELGPTEDATELQLFAPQVNAAEEPPPEYLVEVPTELEVGPSQEPSVALNVMEPEEPMTDLDLFTYSM